MHQIESKRNPRGSGFSLGLILFTLFLLSTVQPALAFNPAVLFDTANLDENGYTSVALKGIRAFEKFRNLEVRVIGPSPTGSPPQTDIPETDIPETDIQAMVRSAAAQGFNPIIGVGFSFGPTIETLAPEFPQTSFIIIDAEVRGPNIESVVFREQEGSFLMGYLAGLASKTMKVGFVGGMDCPLVRRFGCAFAQGAGYLGTGIQVYQVMTGDTIKAFTDPDRGAQLTRELAAQGVDVVFHGAGLTGLGVIKAAAETGILAIGVDSNQNALAPGHVLTSMLKRMDAVLFLVLSQTADGQWQPGRLELGLKEGGIDWALDRYNLALVTDDMQDRLDELAFGIISGQIKVYDYSPAAGCPYYNFDQAPARAPGD